MDIKAEAATLYRTIPASRPYGGMSATFRTCWWLPCQPRRRGQMGPAAPSTPMRLKLPPACLFLASTAPRDASPAGKGSESLSPSRAGCTECWRGHATESGPPPPTPPALLPHPADSVPRPWAPLGAAVARDPQWQRFRGAPPIQQQWSTGKMGRGKAWRLYQRGRPEAMLHSHCLFLLGWWQHTEKTYKPQRDKNPRPQYNTDVPTGL